MTNPLDVFRDGALAGHVAVVTGGGTGICKGIAAAFARFGCEVCITSRKQDVLDATAAELKAATGRDVLAIAADVRDPDAMVGVVEAAKARFGKVDTLVNGAAGNFLAPAIGLSPNAFRTVIDIDLVGSFHAARAAFPALRDAGDGLIINITATLHYHGTPLQLHASAAKAGVDAMTRNLAVEWAGAGVRVVSIAPGPIAETEGMKRLAPGDAAKQARKAVPLGRFGSIDEIAASAVYMRSAAAAYITGTVLVVDGGNATLGAMMMMP
ncbi:MAG: SDR family oxidoreductase [Deltaproteobacteria bacterium]|nr:SDR family oxidoreductase [Kofleriaceae bacterium]